MNDTFAFENYKINLDYEKNTIEFNIENTRDGSCYRKRITHEMFHKMRYNHSTNISDMKSAVEFYKRSFEGREGYSVSIYQTPIYREGERSHNELIMKCVATLDGFYELYSHYEMEERILTFEEKMSRMMEKIKSVYEEKIEILEKEIDELRYSVRQRKNSIDLLKKYDDELNSTSLLNNNVSDASSQKVDVSKGEVDKKNHFTTEGCDQTFFYDAVLKNAKEPLYPTAMSRKEFIYKYEQVFSVSPYMASFVEFMNDEVEEVIYHGKITLTNRGKLFFIIDGVKVHNYARIFICDELMEELHGFSGTYSSYEINCFFEELRKKYRV